MKITPADLERMRAPIAAGIAAHGDEWPFVVKGYRELRPGQAQPCTLLLFDLMHRFVPYHPVLADIYEYANDNHLETALRAIVRPLMPKEADHAEG